MDRIDQKDVDAGRASPLFPNVAETMARVLGQVKSREKKIGAAQPRGDASLFWVKRYARQIDQAASSGLVVGPERLG